MILPPLPRLGGLRRSGTVLGVLLVLGCVEAPTPSTVDGRLDLSRWDFEADGTLPLYGDWHVCWGELLEPGDGCSDGWSRFPVPRLWSDSGADPPPDFADGKGVATYRLVIELPAGAPELVMYVGAPMTAYRLWIAGEPRGGVGRVGRSASATTARLENREYAIAHPGERLEVLVHVANFEFRGGGLRRTWLLGSTAGIRNENGYAMLRYSAFAVGSIVVGLLFLAQFALRPQEATRGWFGAFAVLVGLRIVPASTGDLPQLLLGWAPFAQQLRLEYLNTALLIFVGGGYLQSRVPGAMPPRLTQMLRFSGLALVPIHLLGSLETVQATLWIILVVAPLGMVLTIASYGRAWRRGVADAGPALLAALVFSTGVVHDVFRTLTGLGAPIELFPYFVLVWIASEAFSLLRSFSRMFATVETRSGELQDANLELQETEETVVRFVNFDLLRLLGKRTVLDVRPGDHAEVRVTVLACALRADTFESTSRLLARADRAIRASGGFVGQHLGDEWIAVFGADAVDAAKQAGAELVEIAREQRAALRAGIATGIASVGAVGSDDGLSVLVTGPAVTAARAALANTTEGEIAVG